MKLPSSLAPWAKHLQIFPDEISLMLGEYVRKISSAVAPLDASAADENGEPNGYDGVARRGIYERLLLSELALADDFADEFVRRAVMNEHLFLNLAKVLPGAKRVSIGLFDAGAMQIGKPRIAHLAALIVLARRAEAAGAVFLWGVLQDAKHLVIADDTEASVKILLESRTARTVSTDDLTEWREKLSDIKETADVWLIGGEDLAQIEATKNYSRLCIEENLELEKNELLLKIKGVSSLEKSLTLELPPPNLCTRLLRNPFESAPVVTTAKLDGTVTNFFFDGSGSKLFARLDSNEILAFPVQNTPSKGKIYPTVYRLHDAQTFEPRKVTAVGRLRKAVAFVSKIDDQKLRLEYRKIGFSLPAGIYELPNGKFAVSEDETSLLELYNVRPKIFHYDEAAVIDANRNLFVLSSLKGEQIENRQPVGTAFLTAKNVLAAVQTGDKFLFVGCEDGNEYHHLVSISDKIERRSLGGKRLRRALFGRGENGKKILATEDDVGSWLVWDETNNSHNISLPKGKVVGVCHDARLAPTVGFFELMNDHRTLEFSWNYGRRKHILTAEEEISKIKFSPRSPIIAYQTTSGELVLYSLTHRAAIGRYSK